MVAPPVGAWTLETQSFSAYADNLETPSVLGPPTKVGYMRCRGATQVQTHPLPPSPAYVPIRFAHFPSAGSRDFAAGEGAVGQPSQVLRLSLRAVASCIVQTGFWTLGIGDPGRREHIRWVG